MCEGMYEKRVALNSLWTCVKTDPTMHYHRRLRASGNTLLCQAAFWVQKNVPFVICFRDFKVSSVVYAGDCIPTEVFIFSIAGNACECLKLKYLYLYHFFVSTTVLNVVMF